MRHNLNRKLIWLAIGSLAILLFLEFWLRYDSWERQIALAITNIIALGIYLTIQRYFQRRYQINLPWFVIWSITVAVWLDAIGNFAHYYVEFAWWDDFTHVIGTMAVTIAIFVSLYYLNKFQKIRLGRFALPLFSVAVSMLLASFYEVTEYWGDLMFATNRIGAKFDTASDLQWNLLGAVIVVLVANLIIKNRIDKKGNR